jgi:hypothetical protein
MDALHADSAVFTEAQEHVEALVAILADKIIRGHAGILLNFPLRVEGVIEVRWG